MKKINENGTFRKRSPEWNFLKTLFSRVRVAGRKRNFSETLSRVERFENAVFVCTRGQTKTELFENAEVTLSVSIHSAQYSKLIQDGGRALPFIVFYTWAYLKPSCLFSSKFSFVNSSSRLFQETAEHYQVTFATRVKKHTHI